MSRSRSSIENDGLLTPQDPRALFVYERFTIAFTNRIEYVVHTIRSHTRCAATAMLEVLGIARGPAMWLVNKLMVQSKGLLVIIVIPADEFTIQFVHTAQILSSVYTKRQEFQQLHYNILRTAQYYTY